MVNRGEIWWTELSEPKKSEPGYKRPLVIIQSNSYNRSNINTAICAVITSNLKLAEAPGNILLNPKTSGLPKTSVINISQIITIDKSFLIEKVGELTNKQINRLENSLKLILSLD
jgi:mRNA interferase MazF